MSKPDFLVIGAQKAGTTWLDRIFKINTEIWTPPVKELQFFNELYMEDYFGWTKEHRRTHAIKALSWIAKARALEWDDVNLLSSIGQGELSHAWYQKIFDYAPAGSVKGEITPEYSLLKDEHVKEVKLEYPDVKIIFVLRDPLERTVSHLKMRLLQEGFDERDKSEALDEFCLSELNYWDVIERSNYSDITERWLKYFGGGQCLFLLADDLSVNPDAVLKELSGFIGLKSSLAGIGEQKRIHASKSFFISDTVFEAARSKLKQNIEWYNNNSENYRMVSEV